MNFLALAQSFFAPAPNLLLRREVNRLASQLGITLNDELTDEDKAILLLQRISMQVEISRHTPQINKPNNLAALDLKKHPLKQAGLNYKDLN
jgi:hypothetical protein